MFIQNKIGIPAIFICLLDMIVITMIGLVSTRYMLDAFSVSIIPIIGSSAILLLSANYRIFSEKKNIICSIILTCLFIFMLSLEEIAKMLLSMERTMFNNVFILLYPIVLIISLLIDTDYILFSSLNINEYRLSPGRHTTTIKHDRFLGIYTPVWVIVLVMYVFMLAYFPGTLNNDFNVEWLGGGHPVWSDYHTVGFAFFVRFCTLIIHEPFMVTLAQTLMYILTANYTLNVLYRHFGSYEKIGHIYVLLYIVFCSYCCMNVADIVKDNCCMPMLLAFAVSVLDYTLSSAHDKSQYVNMTLLGFLASIFRHIFIAIVIITLIAIIIYELCDKKSQKETRRNSTVKLVTIAGIILVMYLLLTEVFAFRILKAERVPANVKYAIPMNLAGSMAYRNSVTGLHIDDDIVALMEEIIPLDKWAEFYSPFDTDTLSKSWHEIGINVYKLDDPRIAFNVIKVDWYYLTHYPKQCILSYFDVTSPVWEISKAQELDMYSPASPSDDVQIHHLRKGSFYTFCESTKNYLASFAIGRAIVYRGGIYLYVLAIATVILFKKKRIKVWLAMLPIIIYAFTLMLSIPGPISRYTMGFSLFAVLFGLIAFVIEKSDVRENQGL